MRAERDARWQRGHVSTRLGAGAVEELQHLAGLGLVHIAGTLRNQFRLALDPVAKYMAALYLLSMVPTGDPEWATAVGLLEERVSQRSAETASFVGALQECWDTGPVPSGDLAERLRVVIKRSSGRRDACHRRGGGLGAVQDVRSFPVDGWRVDSTAAEQRTQCFRRPDRSNTRRR
jgi:hypothetical protein